MKTSQVINEGYKSTMGIINSIESQHTKNMCLMIADHFKSIMEIANYDEAKTCDRCGCDNNESTLTMTGKFNNYKSDKDNCYCENCIEKMESEIENANYINEDEVSELNWINRNSL
jgi:hypothetical protein